MKKYILAALILGLAGCASAPTTPSEPTCKHPENVFTASTEEAPAKYIGNDGKEHKCSFPGGHCKGATYNACSASEALCCTKN